MTPNTEYEDRLNQVDFRLTKMIALGKARLRAMVDMYNVFNANTVLAATPAYGSTWLRPTAILTGRLFKFGAQVDF